MGFALVVFALLSTIAAAQGDTDAWRPRLFPRKVLAQRQDSGKYVVAHHMVGNTYPYTIDTWRNDINMALANGIDGFALNVGSDSWQAARVADAYTAALGTNFKLFLSLDMTSLPCASSNDAVPLRQYVTNYANHPNQLIYRSRVLLTTFSGSACTFGQSSVSNGWVSQLTSQLTGGNQIWFVPSFFDEPSTFGSFKSFMDGELNWNSAWPVGITAGNIDSLRSATGSLQTALSGDEADNGIISALSSTLGSSQKIYIPTISPWFFAHYGPSTYNKNWIYYSDRHMYNTRWEDLVAKRAKFDIVQLLTWNDYGESSYVGPIEGAQPDSQAWVNGFDHTAWLPMTKYYARAFKTGLYPKIKRDQIYLICRPHAREAQASSDPVGPPANYMMVEDKAWAVVFATQPAQFTLSTSATNFMRASVPAGVSKFSISISPGDYMRGQLTRSTWTIVDHRPSFTFQGAPQDYNFNAFVSVSP